MPAPLNSEAPSGATRTAFLGLELMMFAKVVYHFDGSVSITFPFNREMVDALKTSIPAAHRSWDPARRGWTVRAMYANTAMRLLQSRFDVEIEDQRATTAPDTCACAQHPQCRVLFVQPDAPPEVIESSYRALARLHHPDRGGDGTTMQRVNAAYAELTQERGRT